MLSVLKDLSTVTLILCAVILICGMIRSLSITPNYYILVIIVAASVAVWGYSFSPNPSFDLFRLYKNIDAMRSGTFKEAVLESNESSEYAGYFAFNALCYIVSWLGDNRWLSAISVFTVFSIMLGVLISYFRHEGYSSRGLVLCICMIFSGMQMPYVFSGVRNAMAVSLTILALYLYFYLEKRKKLAIALYVCACTTHPMVLVVLPAVLLCNRPNQRLFRCVALLIVPFVFGLIDFFAGIQMPFFQNIAHRLSMYQNASYGSDRPEMIANFIFFGVIGFSYWHMKNRGYIKPLSSKHKKFENVYYLIGIAMLGSVVHRDFTLRIGYIMGALNIPMMCRVFLYPNVGKPLPRQYSYALTFAIMGMLICILKVFYDSYYTMSRMDFNLVTYW